MSDPNYRKKAVRIAWNNLSRHGRRADL